jgi:hypothetical protein
MIDKHPINSLVNSETVSDIFLELEDTFKFDVDVQCEMGKPISRELITFHEMKTIYDRCTEDDFFKSYKMVAVEKSYEITKYHKVIIITINEEFLKKTCTHPRIILQEDYDSDLKDVLDRAFEYIGKENITYIHRDMRGLDRDHRPFVVGYEKPKMITSPVLAIYFDSYGAKEYK